ncbi:MAG: hypothetical protein U5L05_14150 [Rubrivivax sp.]|nr:hypothetical protein [Rubrivivax sp.]
MASTVTQPDYIDPAGDAREGSLPVWPPFQFTGVTARVFPLKANMARLAAFCDAYVNMDIPPEIVHYRPALPYVYLMVLDYGSMSSASMHAQNVGWVAQHEVAFTVPLERWRKENGKLVFKDWACVSPFIFVDDEMSLTTGREVYGWPKVAGTVDASVSLWASHPLAGSRVFSFSTQVFPHVYAGKSEEPRVLLTIDADPALSYARFPVDGGNAWAPWNAISQATRSSLSLLGQAADLVMALPVRGFRTDRSLGALKAMGTRAAGYLARMGPPLLAERLGMPPLGASGPPGLTFDNITVKQFRDAQEPDRACYKALVRSRMGVERINRSGLLGDSNLLRGDTSGGYTIRVHRYSSQPIIQSLGIEVTRNEEGGEGTHISVLKPVFPFWNDVDLYYGAGELVCSRIYTHGAPGSNGWVDAQPPADSTPPVADAEPPSPEFVPSSAAPAGPALECAGDYNTALGAATQPVAGPFQFPDVTLQVYPLLADRAQLDSFVERYLNEPLRDAGLSFETMGAYAYLMVNITGDQTGTMWSSANNIGWWASREVSFCVPVRWYRTQAATGQRELISVGLVAPFVYANSGRAVITDREVNGRPSVKATIESPQDVWLEASGPAKPRQYLRLATEVFPALGLGQQAEERTLLQVDGDDVLPWNDSVGWRLVGERWGQQLVGELVRKHQLHEDEAAEVAAARALALELLAHGAPINSLVLKQYRAGDDVGKACYQALVRTQRSIERIYDMREITERVHLRLHRYPGHPIAQTLGLQVKSIDSVGGEVVQNLQPLHPFWMRISLREELGEVVAVRRHDGGWDCPHPWLQSTEPSTFGYGKPRSDAGAVVPATGAAETSPYFQTPGPTRVSTAWPAGPQRLREQQQLALRAALASSLQALTDVVAALPEDEARSLEQALAGPESMRLAEALRHARAGTLATWVDAQPVPALQALERALVEVGLNWEPADPAPRRLTHAEAGQAIEALSEVQLVVESILGAEWEHWGNPRFFREPPERPPRPEPCLPAHSLQGGIEALQHCAPPSVGAGADRLVMDTFVSAPETWVYLKRP